MNEIMKKIFSVIGPTVQYCEKNRKITFYGFLYSFLNKVFYKQI
jgi:hypothetical protein